LIFLLSFLLYGLHSGDTSIGDVLNHHFFVLNWKRYFENWIFTVIQSPMKVFYTSFSQLLPKHPKYTAAV
jgi:hypothetical protein